MDYTGTITQTFEGYSLIRYQDGGGVWTIGRGHLWHPGDELTCTVPQVELWFSADMAKCAHAVNDLVSVELTQGQFNALCDFVFNLGIGALESSTLLKLINAGELQEASKQFVAWDHIRVDGELRISEGLLRRRTAETTMFLLAMVAPVASVVAAT